MSTYLGLAWRLFCVILSCSAADGASRRVLYVTTSAGFRHDSLETSAAVLKQIGERSGLYELVHTEDLRLIESESLKEFSAVLFFTSGELALGDGQKAALATYVKQGGSFGGFHSATDTLYSWPEYGQMIGAYFDGHPWVQAARVLKGVDDPITSGLGSPWTLVEEFYQFRDMGTFRTLLSLDPTSVDLNAAGVKASRFPLAWAREHGVGRVFYSALGHFDGTWRSVEFQRLVENAMRWLVAPEIAENGVGNAATMSPADAISPGAIISIYGRNLSGSTVAIGGRDAPVLYSSPLQINAVVPMDAEAGSSVRLRVGDAERSVRVVERTPGIFAAIPERGAVTVWMTGLGRSVQEVAATIGGQPARVLYAGIVPEFAGLYQVNLEAASNVPSGYTEVTVAGAQTRVMLP